MSAVNRLLKFGVVGILATLIHILIVSLLVENNVLSSIPFANLIAFLVATTFSYIGNTKWSFADSFNRNNATRFAITAVFGCVLAFSLSWVVDTAGYHYLFGIALIVAVIPGLTFLSHYFWTYQSD